MADDLLFDDPCILFALRRESSAFCREFRPQEPFPGAPCWAKFCGPSWLTVLVLESGVGPVKMATALEWLLAEPKLENLPYRPKLVLSAGFAGALQHGQSVGDLVLATEVEDEAGARWPTTWPGELPAGPWQPALHRGRLLTVPRLIGDPVQKRALGQQHGAMAVDMESATLARLCTSRGIPFGCMRAISDDVHTPLSPKLLTLLKGGRVSPWRLLTTLIRSPRLLGELLRLGKASKLAARELAKGLGELLTLTLPWMKE